MDVEAGYILSKYAGYSKDIYKYLSEQHKTVLRPTEELIGTSSYQKQYLNISKEHMNVLHEIYAEEIKLFDYPTSPFVDFQRS